MQKSILILIAGSLVLTACNDGKKPSDANFTKAINQYLENHGEVCTTIGRQFPVDIPESEQKLSSYTAARMAALEQAGLVHSISTTAVVQGMPSPFSGPSSPQPMKRYELTAEGQKYYRQVPSVDGQTGGFCYGQKAVDAIVKWTEPMTTGAYSQTEVTYTYRIAAPASWAENQSVQQVFPNIRTTINGASRTTQIAGLQSTNKGWEVPGQ